MAKKVTAKKNMVTIDSQLAADAEKEYAGEKSGGAGMNIGIRGSEFRMNGEDLGDEMTVVVVATAYEHAYYDNPYNPDDPQPPGCFALGVDEDDLAPHPDSPAPQADTCAECWANEWGSSNTGRGKACKNSRRLALLAAGEDGIAFGETPILRVPPTSLRNWSGYAKRSVKVTQRPTYGLITKIGFDENADWETLTFELAGKIEDPEVMAQVIEARKAAESTVLEPFDTNNYKAPEEVKQARRTAGQAKAKPKAAAARTKRSKMS